MGKYGLKARIETLKDGHRVVLQPFFRNPADGPQIRKPAVVATFKSDLPFSDFNPNTSSLHAKHRPKLVTAAGEDICLTAVGPDYYRQNKFIDEDGYTREVLWTLPLPMVSDEDALNFVMALQGMQGSFRSFSTRNDHEPTVVLGIDDVGEEYATCRMVSWADETIDEHARAVKEIAEDGYIHSNDDTFHYIDMDEFAKNVSKYGDFAISKYQLTVPLEDVPEGAGPGTLIVGDTVWCKCKQDVTVTRISRAQIAGDISKTDLAGWFPQRDEPKEKGVFSGFHPNNSRVPMQTIQYHMKELARAKAALIPSEALVLVFPREEGDESYCRNIVVLGTQGVTFFEGDGTENDYIESIVPDEGGLWVLEKAAYWSHHDGYTGEWDGGIDGDFRPAEESDLAKFGFTKESVIDETEEFYETGDAYLSAFKDGSFTDKMMEVARDAQSEWQKTKSRHIPTSGLYSTAP